ncbi:MAG: 4-(cytidine 5'-diphospho)-2-C-methyl-D-erythritol kinase [Gemmatimonadota bacterium]
MNSPTISVEACAKVNLRLAVLARETTGYHSLETIFCGISLSDRIVVEPGERGVRLEIDGHIDTGPLEENLVFRAATAFYDAAALDPSIHVQLEKRIPSAAGLGGGSSDAAATLRALSELHGHPLPPAKLLRLAADLGSDVPFFMTSTPFALAWSRGERLLELPPLPSRPVLVAHPGGALPTAAAFARLSDLRHGEHPTQAFAFPLGALDSWQALALHASNDLEFVAFERVSRLPHALRSLLDAGAVIALLAGSGASIFGIFEADEDADRAAGLLAGAGFATWRATTLERWPPAVRGIDQGLTNG